MVETDRAEEIEQRLAEVDALRRRVVNVIPHALRTPITTLGGLAMALSSATEQQVREEIAPALQRLAMQAESLLDDMLIAAGMSTALPTERPVPTAVIPVAEEVWVSLGGEPPLVFTGDRTSTASLPPGVLFKVLVHVLDNSIKYGEPPHGLSVEAADGGTLIQVTDRGEVTQADLTSAVEPFFRGERAVIAAPGLGVGLAVVAALLDQVGGHVAIESSGQGTTVTLQVPRT
ncbi:MAG: sensor histidine kinase [Acidimicrobiales bacterium]